MSRRKFTKMELVLSGMVPLLIMALSYLGYRDLDQKRAAKAMNSKCNDLAKKLKETKTGCHKDKWSALHPPCSPQDNSRKVVDITDLGKICIEKTTKDHIKTSLLRGESWETEHVQYFEKYAKKGSTVLDIGAHIGIHTLRLSKVVGDEGRVHSFEPQSKIYQELLANLNLNKVGNVRAHFVAVGDQNKRISMNLPGFENEGATGIGEGGNRVELRTIDSFHLNDVSFMKIDVEGFEIPVLKGAEQTIRRNNLPVIIIELWQHNIEQQQQSKEAVSLLKSYGYRKIIPLSHGIDNFLVLPE